MPSNSKRANRLGSVPVAAVVASLAALYGSVVGACDPDDGRPLAAACPNAIPVEGEACDPPGLQCSYADPTGCTSYFLARCSDAGVWVFEGRCEPAGGSGGATTTTTSVGGLGGSGGTTVATGGSGGCDDPNGGPPAVLSALSAVYAPDTTSGAYRLELDEPVVDLASHLDWWGPGGIDAVSKIGSQLYRVRFSGVAPGESAVLVVLPGLSDSCGNVLESEIDISLSIQAHCYLLEEDFSGDLLSSGWSTTDDAGDGNTWARNDEIEPAGSVANHTQGLGTCAAADDTNTGLGSAWDTMLYAPLVDLSEESHVVLAYERAFEVPTTDGEAWLEASSDGMSWQTLQHWTSSQPPARDVVDLSAYAGELVTLRWRYSDESGAGGYLHIDDVCVESYTQASCPCPGGGFTELKDVLGVSNGNGTLGLAEQTGALLQEANDRLTACGRLEASTTSGADVYAFDVATTPPGGSLDAVLSYCIENSLQDATVELWEKSTGLPVVTLDTVHAEGAVAVSLSDDETYYLLIRANEPSYTQSRYTLSVNVDGATEALLSEGFELWPPVAFTVTDEDLCLDWAPATETVVPSGGVPTEGYYLAYFNSYDCQQGSESLQSDPVDLTGVSSVMLTFDMYHDTGYAGSFDNIQVQVNTGSGWVDVGMPFERPGTVVGWASESLDLSSYAGQSSVRIGLRATTEYGNNVHIDNVKLAAN